MFIAIHAVAYVAIEWCLPVKFSTFRETQRAEEEREYRPVKEEDLGLEVESPKRASRRRGIRYQAKPAKTGRSDSLLVRTLKRQRQAAMRNPSLADAVCQTDGVVRRGIDNGAENVNMMETSVQTDTFTEGNQRHDAIKDGVIDGLSFMKDSLIASGKFGQIHRAIYKGGDVVVRLAQPSNDPVNDEAKILARVKTNPFIIRMLASYMAGNEPELKGVVLNYAVSSVQGLMDHLRQNSGGAPVSFDNGYADYVASGVGSAIVHIHKKGFAHLDVCPRNVLLSSSGVPQLTGFAGSLAWSSCALPLTLSTVGSDGFRAPEVILGWGYTTDADWFSYGALLYYMLHGHLPWPENNEGEILCLDKSEFSVGTHVMEVMRRRVRTLLWSAPEKRMSKKAQKSLCREKRSGLTAPITPTLKYARDNVFNH